MLIAHLIRYPLSDIDKNEKWTEEQGNQIDSPTESPMHLFHDGPFDEYHHDDIDHEGSPEIFEHIHKMQDFVNSY